jgi:hypothetical protein
VSWERRRAVVPTSLAATVGFALFGLGVAVTVGLLCYFLVERLLAAGPAASYPTQGGTPIRAGA